MRSAKCGSVTLDLWPIKWYCKSWRVTNTVAKWAQICSIWGCASNYLVVKASKQVKCLDHGTWGPFVIVLEFKQYAARQTWLVQDCWFSTYAKCGQTLSQFFCTGLSMRLLCNDPASLRKSLNLSDSLVLNKREEGHVGSYYIGIEDFIQQNF